MQIDFGLCQLSSNISQLWPSSSAVRGKEEIVAFPSPGSSLASIVGSSRLPELQRVLTDLLPAFSTFRPVHTGSQMNVLSLCFVFTFFNLTPWYTSVGFILGFQGLRISLLPWTTKPGSTHADAYHPALSKPLFVYTVRQGLYFLTSSPPALWLYPHLSTKIALFKIIHGLLNHHTHLFNLSTACTTLIFPFREFSPPLVSKRLILSAPTSLSTSSFSSNLRGRGGPRVLPLVLMSRCTFSSDNPIHT